MTILKYISLAIILPLVLITACKEYNSLDSIRITPLKSNVSDTASSDIYICDSSADGFRQFEVIGTYEDDDTEDLSSEVTWEVDTTHDVLDDTYPGLIICNDAHGIFGVKATYTIDSGESSEGEGTSATELADSIIVNAQ